MVTIGSNSLSPGISVQPISMAPGAPGEHGVNKSSTMRSLFLGHGPLTYEKEYGQEHDVLNVLDDTIKIINKLMGQECHSSFNNQHKWSSPTLSRRNTIII